MSVAVEIRSDAPATTVTCGRALGELLEAGALVALTGPLGSGKTLLVKGIALGLGVPADEPVVSPTFVLVREYHGRLTLYHLDAYRLRAAADLLALGLDEMRAQPNSVVAIEWADRVAAAIAPDAWRVELEHVAETTRRIRLSAPVAARQTELADRLRRLGHAAK